MKIYAVLTFFLALIMLFFPFIALNNTFSQKSAPQSQEAAPTETVKLQRVDSGNIIDLELYDYLVGAVASEMPASYEKEALKAQAIVCYTYLKWQKENPDSENYDISDSSDKHQGYISEEELKEFWGDKYNSYIEKIRSAVSEVYGEYLSYENETAMAVFHALSPGVTENAENVWGNDIPYLKSISAPGDRLSPDYSSEVKFSKEEMMAIAEKENLSPDEKAENLCVIKESTDSGYVKVIEISGKEYSGTEARTIFSLNSPFFTVQYENDEFTFTVYGKGHGVGMSQYSADYMARQGSDYKEILLHFYEGTEIKKDNLHLQNITDVV